MVCRVDKAKGYGMNCSSQRMEFAFEMNCYLLQVLSFFGASRSSVLGYHYSVGFKVTL